MSASRLLPRKSASNDSRDLERVIAGAVVLGADLSALSGTLQPDDFTDAGLATIVRVGLAMQAEGFGRDNATLAERLRAMPVKGGAGTWLDRIGGSATLLVLQRECPAISALPQYVQLLHEKIRRRRLMQTVRQAETVADNPVLSGAEAEEQVRALFAEAASTPSDVAEPKVGWPDPMAEHAWHGLAGDIVRRIEPTTEADSVALLLHVLAYYGSAAGLVGNSFGPHVLVEDTRHGPNEFFCLVGATSKARKGTAERRIRKLFRAVDERWADRIRSGLSSGEGVIWNVRDATLKDGKIEDPGESDKRLLVVESELAVALRRIEHEGSSLSPILRDAWDGMPLSTLVSERGGRSAVRAQRHHVTIMGHITRSELTRYLTRTEMANGLGNRFLWALVKRSKCLPRGASAPAIPDLVQRLRDALTHAWKVEEIDLDLEAQSVWGVVYPALSDPKPGLAGEMVARAEAHVLRLALIYALLDLDTAIQPAHLLAALSVWTYCEDSVRCMFAAQLGDPDADAILELLRQHEDGMTALELRDAFNRNWPSERIQLALKTLIEHGAADVSTVPTRGRPASRYRALAGSRTNSHSYVENAVNALNAETRVLSSKPAATLPAEGTRKVGGDEATQVLPRTLRVLTASDRKDKLSSEPPFPRITAFNAYRAPVAESPNSDEDPAAPAGKSPTTHCACGAFDWELHENSWRCHSCGLEPGHSA